MSPVLAYVGCCLPLQLHNQSLLADGFCAWLRAEFCPAPLLYCCAGAGKTTLMDVLAGRKNSGRVEGQIWVGGYPKEQHSFARVCGYVEQTDIHTPRVSVSQLTGDVLSWYCTRGSLQNTSLVCRWFTARYSKNIHYITDFM
jgi:hypothetical protein